jgi:hypothetical protein
MLKQKLRATTNHTLPSLLEAHPVNTSPLNPVIELVLVVVLALPVTSFGFPPKPSILTIIPPNPTVVLVLATTLIGSVFPPTTTESPPDIRLITVPEIVTAAPPATSVWPSTTIFEIGSEGVGEAVMTALLGASENTVPEVIIAWPFTLSVCVPITKADSEFAVKVKPVSVL